MKSGYPTATGYAGLFPARTTPLWDIWQGPYHQEDDLPARQIASVRYAHPRLHETRPDFSKWDPVPGSLPRVRLVSEAIVSHDIPSDLLKYDVAHVALVDTSLPLKPGEAGTTSIVAEEPGEIEVDTNAPTRQLLVISESWHPGWQMTEDKTATPLVRVYGDYLGCVVGPGKHRILAHFAPKSFVTGEIGTCVGIVFLCGIYFAVLLLPDRLIGNVKRS